MNLVYNIDKMEAIRLLHTEETLFFLEETGDSYKLCRERSML